MECIKNTLAIKLSQTTNRILVLPFLVFVVCFGESSCRKAGLIQSGAHLDIIGAYRVIDENVDYLFFELTENPDILEKSQWTYALDRGDGNFDSKTAEWKPLDLTTGVHLHEMVQCAPNVRCGSFSLPSDSRFNRIALRMLYHPEGSADLVTSASIADFGSDVSAMLYGVFDSSNKKIQIRVEDNFGVPSKADSKKYGMTRKFQIREPSNSTVSATQMDTLRVARNDNYLFPADFCASTTNSSNSHTFTGYQSWISDTFDTATGENGVCMNVDFMDKNGVVLKKHTAFARRNPRFQVGSYNYDTPLVTATKIPVLLSYCSDAVGSDSARDEDFYEYQRNIIGFAYNAEDLCFRVGSDATFRTNLNALLASKLAAAKASATTSADFVFVIVLHQNLSTEFRTFHQIVAEELAVIANSEAGFVSPRLVGGFVYDSRTDFRPSGSQEKFMIWCPSARPKDPSSADTSVGEENCIVTDPIKIGGALLNFVTPMGPFPSLASYRKYVNQFSDRGLVKKPDLTFASVVRNGSTFTETAKGYQVTYFDNEHLIVAPTDRVRVCWEAANSSLLGSLRLREATQPATTPGIDIFTADGLWSIRQGTGDFRIGVQWELPFVGKITYKSPLTVNVVSLIPFSRSFSSYQMLGDSKWLAESMDFGKLLQVCKEYCDHPWFDDGGVYQITSNYSDQGYLKCVNPKYPVFGEE